MSKNLESKSDPREWKAPGHVPVTISPSFFGKWRAVVRWVLSAQAALVVGVGARFWYYFLTDSFWRDESKLLLNVSQKSFAALAGPLDYGQGAPIPFLWLYRLLYLSGAGGELPIRAVSLAASILALFLFYYLARRMISDRQAVFFATWLVALSPEAILFAAKAKPYALDMLVAECLLWLAIPVLTFKDKPPSHVTLLWVAAIAPWVSYPAFFILGGLVIALLPRWRFFCSPPRAKFLVAIASSWSVQALLILYNLRAPGNAIALRSIWNSFNLTIGNWWYYILRQVFYAYLGPKEIPYAMLIGYHIDPFFLGVVGLVTLGLWESKKRWGWPWTLALASPLGLALTAISFKLYLPYGRLFLFGVPCLSLLAGHGAAWLYRAVRWRLLANILSVFLILSCGIASLRSFGTRVGGVREALDYIAVHQHPGDLVFFEPFAAPTIAYYRLIGHLDAVNLKYGLDPEGCSEDRWDLSPKDLLSLMPPGKGVWLVAETGGYTGGSETSLFYSGSVVEKELNDSRAPTSAYITDRVQVRGFSPAFK